MIEHLRDKGLGVGFACRVLGLSESAYYARKKRPKSARRLRDEQLMPLIEQVHAESGGTYGVRRFTRALRRKGVLVARCTVERLMAELGLEGVIRGRRRCTTVPEPSAPRPPDLVDRDFTASRPDHLWVADMTYVRTWTGWVYVAFVLDVFSRTIVGWQVANHMRTELPLDALATDTSGVLWFYKGTGKWAAPYASRVKVGTGGWNTYNQITAVGNIAGATGGDLVARDKDGVLWLYLGKGDGTFATRTRIDGGWGPYTQLVGIGDGNRDGRPDLFTYGPGSDTYFYPSTGDWHVPFRPRQLTGLFFAEPGYNPVV
ncbi:IS3 family transposase [Streptomyces sp. NPDC003393]